MQTNWSLALSKIKDEPNELLRYAIDFVSIKLEKSTLDIDLDESGLTFYVILLLMDYNL